MVLIFEEGWWESSAVREAWKARREALEPV